MQRSPWFAFLVCLAVGLIASVRADDRPNVVIILADDLGFDEYFGIPYSNDMRPVQVLEGRDVAEYPVVQATLTRRYTDRAVDFIERNKQRPFFLYFAHAMPHKPLAANEAYYKKGGHGLYADVMAELDASVGSVLDALQQAGVADKTLVIFSSDNGPWFGGSPTNIRKKSAG